MVLKSTRIIFVVLLMLCLPTATPAVTVNPTGVNTRINGPTVAFLTFIGLTDQRPMEGT